MDVDVPSSSGLGPRSSLPPSSVPLATNNSSTPRSRLARSTDLLALDDDDAAPDEDDTASSRRRPRARNQRVGEIPIVKDATGEKVLESFEIFLKT
jgi:DNA replication licensing factor MCM6